MVMLTVLHKGQYSVFLMDDDEDDEYDEDEDDFLI